MERDVETTSSQPHHSEVRGAGGKLRRPTARKPPATPYSRPPPQAPAPAGQRRWLSKLVVDPACRLISGGASLFFPSLFSKPPPLSDADADDDRDEGVNETDTCDARGKDQNCTINHEMPGAKGIEVPSGVTKVSESISDLVGQKKEIKGDMPDEKGLSDIELLLKGKKFSRDEVKQLMDIINSRAVEVPNKEREKKHQTATAEAEPKPPVASHDIIDLTSERKQGDLTGSLWKPSTPLPQSVMLDEVCASPVEIAKAYMGSRTIETGNFSKGSIPNNDRSLLYGSEFATKPFIPSPTPKPLAYWPGSMVQDQRDYLTPQTHRGRYGLHNFSRTPYSRTIFSKPKSKLNQVQGDNDKWPRPPTSVQKLQTPIFGQGKSKSDALEDNYGSIGPIRRSRLKPGAQTPYNESSFIGSSSVGPSKMEYSKFSQGFLPAFKKNFEPGATSRSSQSHSVDRKNPSFIMGTPTVHPHSSQIARTILEHIDRNPPTPKDKLKELNLAIAWKNSISSSTLSLDPNGQNSLLNIKGSDSHMIVSLDGQRKSVEENAGKSNSLSVAPHRENIISDVNTWNNPSRSDVFLSNKSDGVQIKSSHEAVTNIASSQVLNLQKPPTSVTKPVLSSISIDKPGPKWKFSSDQSSGFTFPVSTASEVLSEPPTPSIMPSFSTSSQHQPKDGADVPTYTFGSTKSEPGLVFSFPSTSSAGIEIDTSDIKFSFGSDKPRLSFGSIGKNAICY